MKPKQLRGYISVAKVAELLGWTTQKARRWLTREGALTRKGRHWYTTRNQLRRCFADVYQELFLREF
jgi:hypothetical protein